MGHYDSEFKYLLTDNTATKVTPGRDSSLSKSKQDGLSQYKEAYVNRINEH